MIPIALLAVAAGGIVLAVAKRRGVVGRIASSAASTVANVTNTDRQDDLDTLDPTFRAQLETVLAELERAGYKPRVWETLRSDARQAWLYSSGRSRSGPIVTWTNDSDHESGNAADVIDGRPHPDRPGQIVGWGSWAAEYGDDATAGDTEASVMAAEFFAAYGAAAERAGLTWGGRWSDPDLPHVQA